jgi:hypothetical protein
MSMASYFCREKMMRHFLSILAIALLMCCTSCTNTGSNARENKLDIDLQPSASPTISLNEGRVLDVSIIRLIATPEKFDGKYVRVVGFVSLEFEGTAIYLHKDDYQYKLIKNCLWLNLDSDTARAFEKFDQKYVMVEGTFNAKNRGHLDLSSGALENIKYMSLIGRRPI